MRRRGYSLSDRRLQVAQQAVGIVEDGVDRQVVGDLGVGQDRLRRAVLRHRLDAGLDRDAAEGRLEDPRPPTVAGQRWAPLGEDEVDVDVLVGRKGRVVRASW